MNVTTLTYAELEHADQVRAPLACYETKSPRLIESWENSVACAVSRL